ncbi:phage tail length tape measure family protein [Delftia lacustris]|uniref:phage tail length tape measure family protein n=1 Tax=Delftia lacustris TaxID=558537 RepID=UPI002D795322|nr:phage tail length tape measure family protein [Delftia lacustris]
MTQEGPKAVVSVVAEDNTKEGLDQVKRGIQETARTVVKAGQEASKGISKMGEGADQTARKLESFEKSWVNSVQRALVAAEAGEKGTAKYFEAWGKYRGIGGDVMEPILAQLRAVEAAQAAAAGAAAKGLGTMGVSAAQTAAALRQVPAQFTDIVVSLQAGQAPLTVLLQQGGQLKDMFGGTGAAAKALGGYVMGLVSPLTLVAAAGAAMAVAFHQGAQENEAFVRSIALTGNASGVTTSQLREYARQIDAVVGTQAQAASGLADFVAAGVRGGEELRRYTQTAIEWEKITGQAVSKTADQFASLQKDPLAAVLKLNEGTNFLTVSVYEQIKALDDQGRKADASKIAMDALDGAMRERSKTIKDSLGYIERGWNAIKSAASGAWDAMLNVGRASTPVDTLAAVRKQIADLEKRSSGGFGDTGGGAATGRPSQEAVERIKAQVAALKQQETQLLATIDAEKKNAAANEESSRVMQARQEFDKTYAKALDKEATLEEKLTKARNEAVAAGKSEADIKTVLAWVTEEHNKANKGSAAAAREAKKELADQAKVYAELAGLSSTYYEELARGQKEFEKGNITQAQYVKYVEDLIKKQPFAIALAKEEAEVTKSRVKAWGDEVKAQEKLLAERQRATAQVEETLRKAKDEEEAHQLAASAGITHAEALARIALARAEDSYQQALSRQADGETLLALQKEIEARRELLGLMQQKGVREANKKAADEAAKDWDKTAQTISRTLSDYIMAGGKDAAQYLKRLFATLVLEPIVQYGVSSLFGMGGQAASVASGGLNPLSMLSGGKSAMGLFGGGAGAGFMNGLGAWGSGGSVTGVLTNPGLYTGAELLGTVAPILLGGIALFKILSGDWFGSRGPNHSGGVASTATTDRDLAARQALGTDAWGNTLGDFTSRKNEAIDKQLDTTVKGMLDMYKALAKIGGVTAREVDIAAGFSTNPKHGDEGAMGFFQIIDKLTGEVLTKYKDRELDADPQKAWAQFVGDMGGALVAEIKKGDIPGWMRDELDALGDNVTIEGLNAAIQKIAVIDASFKNWANTLVGFSDLSAKAQTALLKFSGGIEALTGNINAFYAGFYSEAERAEILQRQVREQLKGLGVDIDPKDGEAAKKAFRKLIEDALASGNTELAAKLLALAQLFGVAADSAQKAAETAADAAKTAADEAARALEESRQKAKDAALANFEAAVAREQEYWQGIVSASQEAINSLTSALNTLKSNARDLYGTVDAVQQMLAAQGMVYIEQALAGVRGGAKLTAYDGLSDAISAARGGINAGRYASQFERERDALILAGQLTELAEKGDAQLSVEERQLKNSQEQLERLDKTLTYWRDLLDGNKAQIDATLSVEKAIQALKALMFPESPATGGGSGGGSKGNQPSWGSGGGGFEPANSGKYKTPTAILSGGAVIYDYADADYSKKLDGLSSTFHKYDGTGDFAGLANEFKGAGGTAKDLAYLYGFTEADVLAALDRNGIPRFDVGTNRVPHDMLAMIHKDEAIVPAPFNPWAGGASMGSVGNAELLAEVRALRSEVSELRMAAQRTAQNTNPLPQMADRFDTVSESGVLRVAQV